MLAPLQNRTYRHLFFAQVSALVGTGLATVALGLLAHELAGGDAGEILGTLLALKMVCYVFVAPAASAIAENVPRKALLVGLDAARMLIALALPFVAAAWQVYALMAVLYVAAAAFTPAFQAVIPDVLTDEADYTKALSLSRLAADLESLVSPLLAALLLAVLSFSDLFAVTAIGFAASMAAVLSVALPALARTKQRPFLTRLTAGLHLYAHTPRLKGLVAISLATAAGGAMVFVNTVVIVQSGFGLSQQATAAVLAAFGVGSILAALALPAVLTRISDRTVLCAGAGLLAAALVAGPWVAVNFAALAGLWALMGLGYSLTITPVGRVLRRSAHAEDRPALFAAQFALSHACWLIAYPLAGFVSARLDVGAAFLVLAVLAALGALAALVLTPARDPEEVPHAHPELAPTHPHLAGGTATHSHAFVIDELHKRWPRTPA